MPIIILIRVFFITAIVGVIVYFEKRRRSDRRMLQEEIREKERLILVAEDLQRRLSEAGSASAGGGNALEKFGLGVLERLCEQYYIYEGTDNLEPKLLKEAGEVIENLRTRPEVLETALNSQKDGLVSRFRSQYPDLKDEYVRLFCLQAAGFNSTTISTLLEKDKQYIYNKIWRLKTKIVYSDAPDRDVFLSYFKNLHRKEY